MWKPKLTSLLLLLPLLILPLPSVFGSGFIAFYSYSNYPTQDGAVNFSQLASDSAEYASSAANSPSLIQFDMTNALTKNPGSQFIFVTVPGQVKMEISMLDTVDTPTYVLNAASYTYNSANGTTVIYSQTTTQTVPVNYANQLGGVTVPSSTMTITTISYTASPQQLSVTTTGSGSTTIDDGSFASPTKVTQNSVTQPNGVSTWSYANSVVTLNAAGAWVISWAPQGSGSPGYLYAVTTITSTTSSTSSSSSLTATTTSSSTSPAGVISQLPLLSQVGNVTEWASSQLGSVQTYFSTRNMTTWIVAVVAALAVAASIFVLKSRGAETESERLEKNLREEEKRQKKEFG